MIQLNKDNFERIISSEKPVVIDFWANWCGPCKILSPVFEKVSEELSGMFIFGKLNIDEEGNNEICKQIGLRAIPTIKVFRNGKEIGRKVGVSTEKDLKEFLANL